MGLVCKNKHYWTIYLLCGGSEGYKLELHSYQSISIWVVAMGADKTEYKQKQKPWIWINYLLNT